MIKKLVRRKRKPASQPEDWRKTVELSERVMAANPGLFPGRGFVEQVEAFCEWQRRERERKNAAVEQQK